MPIIEAEELYRFFHVGDEEVRALRGVNLAIEPGEMIALVGPSGSGKSTLLSCLAGLDEPDGGMVKIMDMPMTRRPEAEKTKLRAQHLGVMRQKDNLFAHLTVLENMILAGSLADGGSAVGAADILDLIGMKERKTFLPAQLSGGERARASLAVAMTCRPPILLLDEPTGEVDAATEEAILSVLGQFCKSSGAVLLATHNPAVSRMATRTLAMKDGRILDG